MRFKGMTTDSIAKSLAVAALAGFGLAGAAGSASATIFDFDDARRFGDVGNAGSGVSAEGNFKFVSSGDGGTFDIFLANTTSADPPGGNITGFGFFLPTGFTSVRDKNGTNGNLLDDLFFVDFTDGTRWQLSITYLSHLTDSVQNCENLQTAACALTGTFASFAVTVNDNVPQFNAFDIDFGAALGGDITGGGSPNNGIPMGDAGGFRLSFTRIAGLGTLAGLATNDFQNDDGTFWCVRWRGLAANPNVVDDEGRPITSDAQCGQGSEPPPGVPEPMTLALFGAGLIGLGVARRRFRG